MTSRETCFLCFVQHGAQFWKCFVRLFRIKASKSLGKSLAGAIAKKKNGQTGIKKAIDYLRMPKLQEIFTTVVIVCHRRTRDSLFCKMFSPLLRFEQEKTVKNFSKKLYTSKLKKSQAVWGRYVYRSFFFSDHSIKQIDSMFPCVCSVINHRGRQNVVKTSVTHSPAARVPSLFLPHFDVICDLLG